MSTRTALQSLFALLVAAPALAQQAPPCAANSNTPRTAQQVIDDVARQRCPAGSRLDVAVTIAGQAIVLQQSGICEADSVRTRGRQVAPDTRVLTLTCILAAR